MVFKSYIWCNQQKHWKPPRDIKIIHRKLLLHLQIIFMQGMQSIETSCKFTFSVVPYKTNTESAIFADIRKCKWKSKNDVVHIYRCWDADAHVTRNLKKGSSRVSRVKIRFDIILDLRYQHRFKAPKQVL